MARSPKSTSTSETKGATQKAAAAQPTPRPASKASPASEESTRPHHIPETRAETGLLALVKRDDPSAYLDVRKWGEAERVVRPAFFRALILSKITGATVPETGLTAFGLQFEQRLNLSYADRDGSPLPPLWLRNAEFKAGASFADAHLSRLDLEDSRSDAAIDLNRARVLADAWLDRLTVSGGLSLMGAEIGGQLTLEGAGLKGAVDEHGRVTGHALSADGAVIKGDVFCGPADGQRFEAEGMVRLPGAEIGGDLSLEGASLKGTMDENGRIIGYALSADGAVIKGYVFCRPADGYRFEAEGEVRLLGAEIGGDLSLRGASLKGAMDEHGHVTGHALSADRAVIMGSIFCSSADGQRFEAEGEVRLLGAEIDGQLNLEGASLKGPADEHGRVTGHALSAERIKVADATFMDGDFRCEGAADFSGASLSDVFVAGTVTAATPDATALNFSDATLRRLRIGYRTPNGAPFDGLTGRGKVNLEGATVDTFDGFHPETWGGRTHLDRRPGIGPRRFCLSSRRVQPRQTRDSRPHLGPVLAVGHARHF